MSEPTATKTAPAKPDASEKAAVKAEAKAQSEREQKIAAGQCVVDSDFHVGRAVNGLVCSYHAMHYLADGTPRS